MRWPGVRIVLRAERGVARERLMSWCAANGVDNLFGLERNARWEAEAPYRRPRLSSGQKNCGETGQYQGPLV